MFKNILIIGFGSIGKKHADILSNFKYVKSITILSSQDHLPYKTINNLNEKVK